jgi:uroporphyrin-III C-methyltransferase/precorrin-2 dehydrogenase/sirohydrochlorin ferrochelatase
VVLVGAGPGDPGLLTLRALRALNEADVILHDRLVSAEVLALARRDAERIEVGKQAGHHHATQDGIHALLLEHARAGRRVVRLKGGDPFVLGRGGEEALACLAAGVLVEVVPGVTSAIAVPGAAGIPVTHRGRSRQVTIASGHEGLDWASLATLEGTLVLLMGVSGLSVAATELMAHGKPATTPVAVVESGFSPAQRTTVGTLATIVAQAREADVQPPAVIVVGSVVDLHAVLG